MVYKRADKQVKTEEEFIKTEEIVIKEEIKKVGEVGHACSRCGDKMIFIKEMNGIVDYKCEKCGKRLTTM
jgi:tRNA(Ile2) C34 agmatinyltransferase TiaS